MSLHFAYGSNMSRALMRAHCPLAASVGLAVLDRHRFVITADGYASVVPRPGASVHGVLWRLAPRDLAALNAYESLDSGLYGRHVLPVRHGDGARPALVYISRERGEGRPKPGYLDLVVAAARDWGLPDAYVRSLERWAPSGLKAARVRETGEIA